MATRAAEALHVTGRARWRPEPAARDGRAGAGGQGVRSPDAAAGCLVRCPGSLRDLLYFYIIRFYCYIIVAV